MSNYHPNMYQIQSLEHARTVFLDALKLFGLGSERKPLYEEKADLYALLPEDFDKVLRFVTGDEGILEWKRLFKALCWIKTNEGKLTIQRRFHGTPIPVIGIDKQMYRLLSSMETQDRQRGRPSGEQIQKDGV